MLSFDHAVTFRAMQLAGISSRQIKRKLRGWLYNQEKTANAGDVQRVNEWLATHPEREAIEAAAKVAAPDCWGSAHRVPKSAAQIEADADDQLQRERDAAFFSLGATKDPQAVTRHFAEWNGWTDFNLTPPDSTEEEVTDAILRWSGLGPSIEQAAAELDVTKCRDFDDTEWEVRRAWESAAAKMACDQLEKLAVKSGRYSVMFLYRKHMSPMSREAWREFDDEDAALAWKLLNYGTDADNATASCCCVIHDSQEASHA